MHNGFDLYALNGSHFGGAGCEADWEGIAHKINLILVEKLPYCHCELAEESYEISLIYSKHLLYRHIDFAQGDRFFIFAI